MKAKQADAKIKCTFAARRRAMKKLELTKRIPKQKHFMEEEEA